ncbi:MAG TPA: response regulator [Candidatus Thermoplasmatota archaeon]|nr:response regulator [Candidatus Thermoplasmatota archaeon]
MTRSRPRVLLVDDEPAILESTRMLLAEMGYDVLCVAHASDILPALRRERPDLLVQDVRMPGLDVQALVQEMRGEPELAKIPVLLFSASMDLDEIAARIGAARHLEKPFKPNELAQAIEGALS